jgi:hypothetical protein
VRACRAPRTGSGLRDADGGRAAGTRPCGRDGPAVVQGLELEVVELPVLKRSDATSAANVELAAHGGLFFLTGGDPGLVVDVLRDSPVWRAIAAAWRNGAALAGLSAGAMARRQDSLCALAIHLLVPGPPGRLARDAGRPLGGEGCGRISTSRAPICLAAGAR